MFLDSRSTATWPSRLFPCAASAEKGLPETLQEEVVPNFWIAFFGKQFARNVACSHLEICDCIKKAQVASDAELHPRIWARG